MTRPLPRSLLSALLALAMLGIGFLALPASAQVVEDPIVDAQYACRSFFSGVMRYSATPICPRGSTLVDVTASFPFDFCINPLSNLMRDDGSPDDCAYYEQIVVEDGTTGFYACASWLSRVLLYTEDPSDCPRGFFAVAFVNLTGSLTKYVCVEENLNPALCDVFPSGVPQNEIRQIGPIPTTSGGFIDCEWTWEFNGDISPVQSCNDDSNNADIEAALEALTGIDDVTVSGGPIAGTIDAPIRIEFVGIQAATDVVGTISINNMGSTIDQDDVTVIDGSANSAGLSYALPGGTVQVFEALPGTIPNDPTTFGPEVTAGPQPTDPATGAFTSPTLVEGDYVVCATGTGAITPSCEIFTISGSQTLVNNVDLPGTISAEITSASTNEIQTFDDFPLGGGQVTGGTYTITFDDGTTSDTTADIQYDADAATIELALEALDNIVDGDVIVTGGPPPVFGPEVVIEFSGAHAGVNVPQITIDSSNLTGGIRAGYFPFTVTEGSGPTQTLTAGRRVSGGTFTLTFDNGAIESSTGALPFNATAAQVEDALNALPSISDGGGFVTVTGALVSDDPVNVQMDVQFNNVPNADVNVLTVDNTNLT